MQTTTETVADGRMMICADCGCVFETPAGDEQSLCRECLAVEISQPGSWPGDREK